MTTPYRHAYLVSKRAGKGCKRAAEKALQRVVADMLRREVSARDRCAVLRGKIHGSACAPEALPRAATADLFEARRVKEAA